MGPPGFRNPTSKNGTFSQEVNRNVLRSNSCPPQSRSVDLNAGPAGRLDHDEAAFIPVPGPAAAVHGVLTALREQHPLGLIELYAGLGLDATAAAWAATAGETPVGFVIGSSADLSPLDGWRSAMISTSRPSVSR